MLVAGEDQVYLCIGEQLEHIPRVVDDVALPSRAGDGDQVVVDDEDLELVVGPGEGLVDELVVLAPHPPVVEVGLRGIDGRP